MPYRQVKRIATISSCIPLGKAESFKTRAEAEALGLPQRELADFIAVNDNPKIGSLIHQSLPERTQLTVAAPPQAVSASVRLHHETLSVATMRVSNPDCSPV